MEVLPFMRYLRKNKVMHLLFALLLSGTLTACQPTDNPSPDPSAVEPFYSLTREDSRTEPRSPTAVSLADIRDELLITDGGDYVLSGRLSGGVHIRAEDQVVHLFLKDVGITAVKGPAIYVESAGKVVITVCGGTENELSDGGSHTAQDTDACLFSMSDLTINGTGQLRISGFYKDAVHAKDYLKIADADLTVQSKRDGLHGNDGILITGAKVAVESEGCGIRTTKSGKAAKGNAEITDAELSVIAGEYGISSERNVYMTGSSAFIKGIVENIHVGGEIHIEEGCLRNE